VAVLRADGAERAVGPDAGGGAGLEVRRRENARDLRRLDRSTIPFGRGVAISSP